MANKEVVKDCRTSVQFEQELQISYAQRGVAVVDIYSAEWGPCRAISETFRRLATEQGDGVHLRFLAAECHSILASLKQPEEQRNPQRPKNIENIRDTLPEGWQSILEERVGQSKPYFLFFKEGKKCGFVEGVNTPQIRSMVKDLCTVKTPASEFISNPRLQEFWDENFNPDESEISLEKFYKGLQAACKYTVSFTDAEKQTLLDAIGVPKDAKDKLVTADLLQKWFGDDDVKTIQVLVVEVLPEYEARATAVQQREAEERKAQEEQRAKEAKEQEERLAAEKAADEERKKAAEAAAPTQQAAASSSAHAHDAAATGTPEELLARVPELKHAADAKETESHHALRKDISSSQLHHPPTSHLTLTTSDDAAAKAGAVLASLANVKTLAGVLLEHHDIVTINAARAEADHKITRHIPSMAKLAEVLVLGDATLSEKILGRHVDLPHLLRHHTLFDEPSIAMTLAATAAVAAPAVVYFAGARGNVSGADGVAAGGSFTLLPFTALLTQKPTEAAEFTVTLRDLPHGVSFGDHVIATHWFAQFVVESAADDGIEATFAGFASQEEFDTAAANFSTSSNHDAKKFLALEGLQKLEVEESHHHHQQDAPTPADAAASSSSAEPAAPPKEEVEEPAAAATTDAEEKAEEKAEEAKDEAAAADVADAAAAAEEKAIEGEVKEGEAEAAEKKEEEKAPADPAAEL